MEENIRNTQSPPEAAPQEGEVCRDAGQDAAQQGTPVPTAAAYLQASPVRFSATYEISEKQYLEFNRFIFEHSGMMRQSRLRMKYMGIAELVAGLAVIILGLILQNNVALFCFVGAALLLGGGLTMAYYPFIFPRQFEKSIHQSFAASGYMGRPVAVDFHDEGIVERSGEPVGALWEDVRGFYETEELALFLMEEHQAVAVPKAAFGESYPAFRAFCEKVMRK